jgi:MYXO-CTERM domain-containing protein
MIDRKSPLYRLAPLSAAAAAAALLLAPAPAGAQPLQYYGGRVISNVEVVQIAWTGAVDAAYLKDLTAFYKAILASTYLDWLTEYDTIGKVGFVDNLPGSEQHIGRGTFAGAFIITPTNGKTQLQDAEIGAELAAQLKSGALPAPTLDAQGNVNSLYMFDFPPGYTIVLEGFLSCDYFGGYHSTISYEGKSVPYGVHPHCGYDFDTATFIHTHELVEAITDTEPGLVEDFYAPTARPIAWVEVEKSFWEALECADICQGKYEQIAGYFVATNWSNYANGCVGQIPICDGSVAPPACRPCNGFDDGFGCSGDKPACATDGPEAGKCVLCTAKSPGSCAGETPACDPATYTCVECVTSADCQDPSEPVCDASAMTCGPCEADSECQSGICDIEGDAQDGQCVDCNDDSQCGEEEHCEEHACVGESAGVGGSGGSGSGGSNGGAGPGCSCRAAGSEPAEGMGLLAALLALAGLRRRPRAPGRSTAGLLHDP